MNSLVRIRQTTLFCLTFFAFSGLYVTQPVLPYLARYFDTTTIIVSTLITGIMFPLAVLSLISTVLLINIPPKYILLLCTPAIAASEVLFGMTHNIHHAISIKLVEGVFLSAVFPALMVGLADFSPKGEAVILYVVASVAGSLAGRVLGGYFIAHGYHIEIWLAIGAGLMLFYPGLFFLTSPSPSRSVKLYIKQSLYTVLKETRMWTVNILIFFSASAFVSFLTYLPFHIHQQFAHITTDKVAFLYNGYIFALLGSLAMPWVWRKTGGSSPVFQTCLVVQLIAIGVFWFRNYWLSLLGVSLVCASFFSLHSLLSAYFQSVLVEQRRIASGLYLSCSYIGGAFSSLVPGHIFVHLGWHALLMYLAGTTILCILVVYKRFNNNYNLAPQAD